MERLRAVGAGLCLAALGGCVGLGSRSEPERRPPPAAPAATDPGRIPADATGAPSPDEQLYAMTISGGVSLGAYEAGVNWAVLESMRNRSDRQVPKLRGVTGASAGSINALLTAIRWCDADTTTTAESNLFHDMWLPVGFDTLLPFSETGYSTEGDGWPHDLLFSRKSAFSTVIDQLGEALGRIGYRDDCDLKVGFTVTSKSPRVLLLRDLHISTQRFVIPLVARTRAGRIRFVLHTQISENQRKDLVGNLLFLAPSSLDEDGEYEVSHKDVIRAALASSAYPGAFGPVELSYCAPRAECSPADLDRGRDRASLCGKLGGKVGMVDAVACHSKFIDGGVFDNVPLGVAMAQIESDLQAGPVPATHRPLRYVYMYPGNRREPDWPRPARPPASPPPVSRQVAAATPLRDTFDFAGGFVDAASEYELHNVLRYNLWNAGTSQLALSVATTLDSRSTPSDASPLAGDPIERAGAVAKQLTSLGKDVPIDQAELATALVEASRVLEQIASQPVAASADDARVHLDAYSGLRQSILTAVLKTCAKGGQPAGGSAAQICGASARDLAVQAQDLQNDARNERQLKMSRRFSPIAGTHIGHFGAFLDRTFRDYDYYAGIYDALWNVAEMSCGIARAKKAGIRQSEVAQAAQVAQAPVPAIRPTIEKPVVCRRRELVAARQRLGIERDSTAYQITELLWRAEHEGRRPRTGPDAAPVYQVMTALFDPERCRDADAGDRVEPASAGRDEMCLQDLDLAAFAGALHRTSYRPPDTDPFMRWVMDHPESGWWPLPGVFVVRRLLELSRSEKMERLSMGSAVAATYLESYVDQHSTDVLVAPSSWPDHGGTLERWPALVFPFVAAGLHPTRRLELGLLRGGIRLGPREDVSGLANLLPWDLLGEVSARVTVRKREQDEDDQGYGLFTRGATTLHASFAPTLRVGGLLWSIGLRAGAPVALGSLRSEIPFKDQVNTEVVGTFLGDKLRFAVGCNPLQDAPGNHCWRDLYYTLGLNDLAGLAYWTRLSPFKVDRLFLPFVALRLTADAPSGEIGLLRGGWQPGRWFGVWGDASVIAGSDAALAASVAVEADVHRWVRRLGVRAGYPISTRDTDRVKQGTAELVLTLPSGIRIGAGVVPFAIDDQGWIESSYVSLGWDPGSVPLAIKRGRTY